MKYFLIGLAIISVTGSKEKLYEEHLKQIPKRRITQSNTKSFQGDWEPLRVEFQYIYDAAKDSKTIDPLLDVARGFFG